jgi:signal transduction histidine kinase/CheY-like chemotaxis protein
MEQASTLSELSNNVLKLICDQSNSIIGALYINDEGTLKLSGKFGISKDLKESYQFGEGLVGTVAKQHQYKVIDHSEAFEPMIDYGITEVKPPTLLIYPLGIDDQIIGILEIVFTKQFGEDDIQYFNDITFVLVNGIQRHISVEKTMALHLETRKLADELELQQEELRMKNEELESQQEELRVTNEELESQQEELRVTNEELQSNFDQIEHINRELELTKEQLQERTNEAELSNQYKSEFLANMSHELRTPLNSILILSNLISDSEKSTPKAKEYASTIHSAGKDLLELINGILDLSKIEAGQEEINVDKWDVKAALSEIGDRYQVMAHNSKIDFNIQLPSEDIIISTDGHKVKQVLTNLVSNAIKFTSEGSVSLNVIDKEKEVEFHITDTGIGIRPENLDVIFKEFKQIETDNNRSYAGTGLGLALCKNYAMLLRGRLTVESVYGEGSTFTLIIPKDAFSNEETKIPYKRKEKPLVTSSRTIDEGIISDDRHRINIADKSVLIVDDDPAVLQLLRDYFNKQKIYTIVSNTGENGLFLADYYLPNLIIVDIKLPKIGGSEIIQKLQQNPRTKEIPVAVISSLDNPKIPTTIPFFKKPLTNQSLAKLVKLISVKKPSELRILLVEDDITHQHTIIEYINNQNISDIKIDTATTKSETISMLKKNLYSLLIVDLSLSDAKNFELVEEIKKYKQFANIPIVVYTGKQFTPAEETNLLTMVDDIIIKADLSPKRLINDIRLFMVSHEQQNVITDKAIFKDKKVLIVDDDIRNIFALTGLLESYNITVMYETSGQKAIDVLQKNSNPDLILMDIMMPEMDGYETMTRIRKLKKYKNTPIIALTAKTMRGDREKCIASGATEYLSKPLNKDKLLSVLRVWLQE